jgi:curved DNA-binding protein CbpA
MQSADAGTIIHSVPSAVTFLAWAESLETMNYYQILRVPYDADARAIKSAFHELSLRTHPDQYVEEEPSVAQAAATVFKAVVEAYGILSKPQLRAKYTLALRAGRLRMNPEDVLPQAPKPEVKTFEMRAVSLGAKRHAQRADRLASVGNFEGARLALVDALREDFDNDDLKQCLRELYQAAARR